MGLGEKAHLSTSQSCLKITDVQNPPPPHPGQAQPEVQDCGC